MKAVVDGMSLIINMFFFFSPFRIAIKRWGLLTAALLLSACGGGGGGGGTQPAESGGPQTPVVEGALLKPSLTTQFSSGAVSMVWSESNASVYRVLYWLEDGAQLSEEMTNATSFDFVPGVEGTYLLMVEAYDENGNSIFSDPRILEVSL